MIVWFGQRFFGKVDVVPGVCHVATRFFYIQFFPVIPLQSFILIAGAGEERGVPTSMSFKSVIVAWIRAVLVLALIGGLILMAMGGIEYCKNAGIGSEMITAGCMILGVAAATYWASIRFSRAGFDRTIELGEQLGIPREVMERRLGQLHPPHESDMYDTVSGAQQTE